MLANATKTNDRARLEELVDRLIAALFPTAAEEARRAVTAAIHQARLIRRSGNPGLAMDTLAALDLSDAPRDLACWAYNEWLGSVRQLSLAEETQLYRAGTGQAAVLEPDTDPDCLRVVATFGMSWTPGRVLSRRCLRGLAPLRQRGAA